MVPPESRTLEVMSTPETSELLPSRPAIPRMDLVHTVVVGDVELQFRDLGSPIPDVELAGDDQRLHIATGRALPRPHAAALGVERPLSGVPAHERLDVPH